MRIAAMAAGAVGGYFGARMAAAGHDVFFIARGAHRDAIARNGLKIESVHGDLAFAEAQRHRRSRQGRPGRHRAVRGQAVGHGNGGRCRRPLLGPDSRLITFQNGVDSVERMAAVLGAERTVGGAAYIATIIASPGVIKHTSQFATMRFGRADKKPDATLNAFVDAGKAAKLDIALSADIERELWQKFIFLTAMAGSTATLAISDRPDRRRSRVARLSSAR